jgi:hypothetical protein
MCISILLHVFQLVPATSLLKVSCIINVGEFVNVNFPECIKAPGLKITQAVEKSLYIQYSG